MIVLRAEYKDKERVAAILSKAFNANKSVNYIIKQDDKREERLMNLMRYAFDVCYTYGYIFLSDDKKACALMLKPGNKKPALKYLWLNLRLVIDVIGLSNIKKVMAREAAIKKLQPDTPFCYLWFIGTDEAYQQQGKASALLNSLLKEASLQQKTICLETSVLTNIPWYEKLGFRVYDELDLGYKLVFMKKEPAVEHIYIQNMG